MRQKRVAATKWKTGSQVEKSILQIHEEKIKELQNSEETIKVISSKMEKLKKEIAKTTKEFHIAKINKDFHQVSIISASLNSLEEKMLGYKNNIDDIRNKSIENDYLLNVASILSQYNDLEEQEKVLRTNWNEESEKEFQVLKSKKDKLHEMYMLIVDPDYMCKKNYQPNEDTSLICKDCNIPLEMQNGFATCLECGLCVSSLHLAEEPSFKEMQDIDYRPQFSYEKMTHLDDWLRRFQAREMKEIPQEILDKLILEAHKERITDLSELTELKVKRYLKKLGLNEYYDNIINIISLLNNRPVFVLTPEVERKIKIMFQQIQEPFERHKPENRKNMLSYSYVLNKFFLILGLPEFSKYFVLLKSQDKLRQQDEIFKKIVEELAPKDNTINWRFFPSV